AGFVLVPHFGVNFALYLAAGLNLVVASVAFLLPEVGFTRKQQSPDGTGPGIVLAVMFFSGAAALMYEVGWTRVLGLVAGPTTYAFTLMLCSMITGLAAGAAIGSTLARRYDVSTTTLAWIEIVIGFASLALIPALGRLPLWVGVLVRQYSSSFTVL